MLTRDKQINELEAQVEHLQERLDNLRDDFNHLEAQVEHLQERLDNLRDDFNHLEDFVITKLCGHIDDRFKELEDYLNIERVKDKTHYISKEKK